MRLHRLVVAGLALSLLMLTQPSAQAASPSGMGPRSHTGTRPPPSTAGHERQAASHTKPCKYAPDVRCGHLRVPLDPKDAHAGKIRLTYEIVPRRDQSRPLLGTIVAVEGGPGYSTTGSRSYYRDLFDPLLDRRRLLLVDNRGTGKSEAILCKQLQAYRGNYIKAVGKCGKQLGDTSDLYGTAFAADDLAAVLDHLGIGRIDLYGDSYGTFFSQTFAVRYPDRVRTLMLDAAYFVGGTDPWYSDTNRAMRDAFQFACRRTPTCAHRPGGPLHRIAKLTQLLRRHPLHGVAANADGVVAPVKVNVSKLINILTSAATTPTIYRELDAAARAALRPHPYYKPMLRLGREVTYVGGAGPVRQYSEGLYIAVACNDYPQPYDMTKGLNTRRAQYSHAVRDLSQATAHLFAPFTIKEWVSSPYGYYADCIRWPAPSRWVHPLPHNATFPDVPTLVFVGDLDSLTSPEGARATATAFPNSTFVETANMTHVSALVDFNTCASVIVRRFVRTRHAGNTSCARKYHENRLVDRFVTDAAGTGWQGPLRRTARIADATLADVMARWVSMYGAHGVGLAGGTFTTNGGAFTQQPPVARWRLHGVKWVDDVALSGTMLWNRRSGLVVAQVTVGGSGAVGGRLRLRWNDSARHPWASARGTLGGHLVRFTFPAA